MTNKEPMCECPDFQCDAPLKIDWHEYAEQHRKGILRSAHCTCSKTDFNKRFRVIEKHETYTIGKENHNL